MKTLINSVAIGLVGSLSLGVFNASADLEVSASVQISATAEFHAPLAAHGAWIEVGSYGRCWRPAHVAVEWRPYCDGHWVWTDCGWYWASDEPWSWACYHYGGWVLDSHHGWVWIPGVQWAPAWVSWRIGGGHCGWAPLPPHGIHVVVAPRSFVFVESRRFHERVRPTTVIVNNTTIINKTTHIAQVKQETRNIEGVGPKKVMVNEGPGLATIEKASGRKARQVSIQEATKQTPVPTEVARKTTESRGKDKAPGEQEKPNSAQERKQAPKDAPEPPAQPGRPDKGDKPPKDEVKPAPKQPPVPDRPPANPNPPDKGDKPPKDGIKPAPERPPAPSQPPTKPSKPPKGKGKDGGKDKP